VFAFTEKPPHTRLQEYASKGLLRQKTAVFFLTDGVTGKNAIN
jgi:hypothetical protein